MIETLKTLCYLSGVSGCEDEVRDYLLERIMPVADKVETDALGNLIVFKKGAKAPEKKVMLCAHMDEVGMIITNIDDDGYLKFDFVGGVDRRVIIGKQIFIGENRVVGIVGIKAYHLVDRSEEKKIPKTHEMYIDIGATSKKEAENLVKLGDYCVFDDTIVEFGDGFIKAKAIDDRLGCAVMLEMIESDLACDTYFAFTTQEEVGLRGATVAAYSVNPDICLVLEGTTAADLPETKPEKEVCTLSGGLVIPFMDRGAIYNRNLHKAVTNLADKMGIKWQPKRYIAGGTDGAAIQKSRNGVATVAIACAVRNLHSPASIAYTKDFDNMLNLTKSVLEEIAEGNI